MRGRWLTVENKQSEQAIAGGACNPKRVPIGITLGLLLAGITMSLSGCGGGGGDGGGTTSPPLAAPCASVINIAPASSTNGALTTSDCTIEALFPGSGDLTFVDQYRITLPSRGSLTIRINSSQFDSFLVLLNSPLQLPEIAIDDDGGGGTDSLISVDLAAGTYIILANSALASPVTGTYTLTIDQPGPTMAFVKVQCAIPPKFFTDQLSLLKIDGRWQIAQKVFMTDVKG